MDLDGQNLFKLMCIILAIGELFFQARMSYKANQHEREYKEITGRKRKEYNDYE